MKSSTCRGSDRARAEIQVGSGLGGMGVACGSKGLRSRVLVASASVFFLGLIEHPIIRGKNIRRHVKQGKMCAVKGVRPSVPH